MHREPQREALCRLRCGSKALWSVERWCSVSSEPQQRPSTLYISLHFHSFILCWYRNKFRAILNANKDVETVPSTPKSTKRKASQTSGGDGTTDRDSQPARKKTKSVDKGKDMDTVTTATDAPVSRKATPVVATDAPDKLCGEVDGTKTEATGAPTSREATPVVATVSAEEDPSGTTFDATANKSSNPVAKEGVARRVKKAVATNDNTRDVEGDSPSGETDASDAKLGSSLDKSHAGVQVFKEASSYL